MKKVFFLPLFIFMAFSFLSCEDDSLDPLPIKVDGQFMKVDFKTRILRFQDIATTSLDGTLSNPSGNVVKYELYVRRENAFGILTGDYVLLETINSFPYEFSYTPQDLATALGITVSDFLNGDKFTFFAYSWDAAGNKAGYVNLARINQVTPTVKQGYKFNTELTSVDIDTPENPYNNHQLD